MEPVDLWRLVSISCRMLLQVAILSCSQLIMRAKWSRIHDPNLLNPSSLNEKNTRAGSSVRIGSCSRLVSSKVGVLCDSWDSRIEHQSLLLVFSSLFSGCLFIGFSVLPCVSSSVISFSPFSFVVFVFLVSHRGR